MIELISVIALVLAVLVSMAILYGAVAIGFGIPKMIVEATGRGTWWLLMFITMPTGCAILFWLIKMIAIYGGIA